MASNRSPLEAANEFGSEEASEEHHPGVFCDGCQCNIRGTRFKCTLCPNYDLCSVCEGHGQHMEHDMIEISLPVPRLGPAQGVLHPGISCDGCGVNIRGIRFKCRVCPDFDLCSFCEGTGIHQEHDMIEIQSPVPQPNLEHSQGVLHPGILCDSCGVNIRGIRFKCTVCPDYDLCSICEGNGLHQEHTMVEIRNPLAVQVLSQGVLHPGLSCDDCGVDIRGIRFKCSVCPDYDLCAFCEAKGIHQHHDMIEIHNPTTRPAQSQVLHPGVMCDGCDVNIRGTRYTCRTCPDYDLCSTCQNNEIHRQHSMLRIDTPRQAAGQQSSTPQHVVFICNRCGDCIRGLRYRCNACPDFDLCPSCMLPGVHDSHQMVEMQAMPSQLPINTAVRRYDIIE